VGVLLGPNRRCDVSTSLRAQRGRPKLQLAP